MKVQFLKIVYKIVDKFLELLKNIFFRTLTLIKPAMSSFSPETWLLSSGLSSRNFSIFRVKVFSMSPNVVLNSLIAWQT